MKIKKLEVAGFKSFVDPAVVKFDHDVTCIVGPNGCGKSNIVDAIRWVMGEQSAKNLRGRAMDDVIFNGSESRGPHSFAEVTITFDNTDQMAPPEYNDYPEIAVTRRLDRQGHSEYLINKTAVRLLDVTNLFLGTGVGRRAYSIIEQGRIGLIVSAKPQDRRHLIEEAAGITKFKAKKRAAERKMEHTQQNLLRVSDIIQEIQKTLSSLKRQAQKAERYKRYRSEIRDLELWIATHRWFELTGEHRVLSEQLDAVSASADAARAALQAREAELEGERVVLQTRESDVEQAQTRAYEADNAVKLLESQIAHALEQRAHVQEQEAATERELASLGQQRDQLTDEADGISARLLSLRDNEQVEAEALSRETTELERRRAAAGEAEQALSSARETVAELDRRIVRADADLTGFHRRREESRARQQGVRDELSKLGLQVEELVQEADALRARVTGLQSGKDELGKHRGRLEDELAHLREDIVVSDQRVEQLRSELASRRSRLHSLEEIQQRFEGVGAGVRAVMTQFGHDSGGTSGIQGLVADRFDCPAELTQALAAALGEKLQYVVVDDLSTGVDAVRYLSEGKRGRATLIPSVPRSGGEGLATAGRDVPSLPGVVGPLLSLIRVDSEHRALAEHMLGDVLVVESLDEARAIHDAGAGYRVLVTRDGHVLSADGSLSGGEGEDAGAHLIEVKREVRELRDVVSKLEVDMEAASSHHGSLRSAIAQRQAALESARTDAHDKEIALVTAEKDLKRSEETRRSTLERIERLEDEESKLGRALDGQSDEEGTVRRERAAAQEQKLAAEQAASAANDVSRGHREAVEAQAAVVTEVRVRAAQAKQQLEGDQAAVERLERSLAELHERERRLLSDMRQYARRQGELSGRVFGDRESLSERVAAAMTASEGASALRAEFEQARLQLGEHEAELRQMRGHIDADVERASELSLREREVSLALSHLVDGVYDRHRTDVRHELSDHHDRPLPDAGVHERVKELLRIVERMGEINLTAIEEYEERSQRHEYLCGQKQDLETALSQLDKAIRQMNRKSRQMFRDTFAEVNGRFKTMFPRMFGGGRAELRLTDPENLLESGIDIVAQPPGKKLTSIELMSGGEKALTAVSLVFAIFQYKPSPFCLLDEVDAPLDEANIERYCDMIRSMTDRSQFILITHSKTTMSTADVLYGVTMETPGISKLVAVEMRDDEPGRGAGGDGAVQVA